MYDIKNLKKKKYMSPLEFYELFVSIDVIKKSGTCYGRQNIRSLTIGSKLFDSEANTDLAFFCQNKAFLENLLPCNLNTTLQGAISLTRDPFVLTPA